MPFDLASGSARSTNFSALLSGVGCSEFGGAVDCSLSSGGGVITFAEVAAIIIGISDVEVVVAVVVVDVVDVVLISAIGSGYFDGPSMSMSFLASFFVSLTRAAFVIGDDFAFGIGT